VNALSPDLIIALRRVMETAVADGVRALVLSGAPGVFSAGLDLPLVLSLDRAGLAELWREFYALLGSLAASPIPVAAAMTGHAPAGGTVIALMCDWRLVAEGDFKLGVNEVQIGIPLPPIVLAALRRQVGPRRAERLAVGGLALSPEKALHAGLVDELVRPDQVVERALRWCQSLLSLPAEAMLATRRRARADLAALFEQSPEAELQTILAAMCSPETQSTLRAQVGKLGKKS
jgi:enoyl-CoA hydratase/carnithine racemase